MSRRRRKILYPALLVALLALFVVVARWLWVDASAALSEPRAFQNAAWISVDWTSQPVDDGSIKALAAEVAEQQIDYLYPFTTYVKETGEFSPSYDYAGDFIRAFRQYDQGTKVLAWIGMPVVSKRFYAPGGWVDLADEVERQRLVSFAADLVTGAGFDGVHLDVEHVDDGDQAYLALLRETKRALGPDKILSVAGNNWLPDWLNWVTDGYKWGSAYYQQVAQSVDQVAAMTYDSLALWPGAYRWWMREQVIGISRAVSEPGKVLIGISISREKTKTHRPQAETLAAGLAGAIAGLNSARSNPEAVQGMAIYAHWEATPEDWQIWQERWLAYHK